MAFKHRYFLIVVLFLLLLPEVHLFAQQGFYVQPFFMYQYVTLANNKDHYTQPNATPRRQFEYVNTYKPAYGVRTIYNFTNAVGFETGLKYSNQGQKYKGNIYVDGNTGDTVDRDFSSELNLNYLQIPLMLSFNSLLANVNDEQDPLYMTIAMGIQLDFLQKVEMMVTPDVDWTQYPDAQKDLKNFFNATNVTFVGNVSLNWQLKHGWQINTTLFASKSLSDVENQDYKSEDYKFNKSKYPLEYQYPVSVKKEAVSTAVRYETNNIVFGLMFGVSYRLFHK